MRPYRPRQWRGHHANLGNVNDAISSAPSAENEKRPQLDGLFVVPFDIGELFGRVSYCILYATNRIVGAPCGLIGLAL